MDMYQEYSDVMQEEILHEHEEIYFSNSMSFEYCECRKLVKDCPDAYEHMSRGY